MHRADLRLKVECEDDARGEPVPRRFTMGARPIEVTELLDEWLAADHRYFKLIGGDGGTYILRHDAEEDIWELWMFSRRG
jgi:hypothetical protein